MKLTHIRDRFEMICSFSEKDEVKAAGFLWCPDNKRWYTTVPDIAQKFFEVADELAIAELEAVTAKITESRTAAVVTDMEIPCPKGYEFYPYQQSGIRFACNRESTFLGDEMGLGKTCQAIGVINVTNPETVLIICPATLKLNWKKELQRWLTTPRNIHVLTSSDQFPTVPDIVVMNYDIAAKFEKQLKAIKWGLFIADEAHYMKNPKAQRTAAILGKGKEIKPVKAARKILLTGTPITNRPIEIFPLVSFLWPSVFNNMWHFGKRYCDAQQDSYGWDFTGASNLEELQNLLRSSGMIRRLKSQVLTELPPKIRQVVVLPSDSVKSLIKKEGDKTKMMEDEVRRLQKAVRAAKAQKNEGIYKNAVAGLRQAYNIAFTEMAAIRKELAIAKIPFVIEYVQSMIDEGEKVVVMAHHREVVDKIQNEFGLQAVKLYGGMSEIDKSNNVDRFQNDPSCMVFIGSISAAGVGITLTAAQKMVFAELDWTPANMLQAEDRIHRIGQSGNALIQQLVFDGSLDAKMAETLVRKMGIIERALDKMDIDEPVELFEEIEDEVLQD